jgi:hypothetical protein
MKHFFSLITAGILIAFVALILYGQVPVGLLRSGLIIGSSSAQSSGVHGTAVFSPATGSIVGLVTTGCVTGVSYVAAGVYNVTLAGCPSNYAVELTAATDSGYPICTINPSSSYTASGFRVVTVTASGFAGNDFAFVYVTIP